MHFLHVQCRTSLEMFCTHGMNQFKSISSLLIFLSVDVNWHIGKSYKLLFPWLIAKKNRSNKQKRISPFSCFPHSVLSVAINRVAQACDQSSLFSVNRRAAAAGANAAAALTSDCASCIIARRPVRLSRPSAVVCSQLWKFKIWSSNIPSTKYTSPYVLYCKIFIIHLPTYVTKYYLS